MMIALKITAARMAEYAPPSVADVFRRQVDQTGRAWIFTSATLAVGRDFSHYTSQLGLGDAATGCWDSPFDYSTQGLLYVPRGLPAPNSIEPPVNTATWLPAASLST